MSTWESQKKENGTRLPYFFKAILDTGMCFYY